MSRFAANTDVSSEKSRSEIERTLTRYGATAFMYGWEGEAAAVAFHANGRRIRFRLPLPNKADKRFTHTSRGPRPKDVAEKAWEQACRQAWRALALVIKAKLEAVESGISEFEEEFLANIVLPDGSTVGQWARPQIAIAYRSGDMPKMLPDYSATRQ
jgi:hypothetical protein